MIKPPIVVVYDNIDVFESVEAAERYLEPPDVRSGQMRIYDRDGRRIRATINRRFLADTVQLESVTDQAEPNELRRALVEFLSSNEKSSEDAYHDTPLAQLLERALVYKTI